MTPVELDLVMETPVTPKKLSYFVLVSLQYSLDPQGSESSIKQFISKLRSKRAILYIP